jgi:predicted O-methyltransferase YrrM
VAAAQPHGVTPELLRLAREVRGFMPEEEGVALYRLALEAPRGMPLLEIGSYCGKSAIYLGAAARELGTVLFSVDHHRGSEEQQPGAEYFDPGLVDVDGGVDTLPCLRRTLRLARLAEVVIPIVGTSPVVARHWRTPLGLVFIDGGHSPDAVAADYEGWLPHLSPGALLIFHDVFEDPAEGGQAPFEVYRRAAADPRFVESGRLGSLRALRQGSTPTSVRSSHRGR